MLPFKLIPQSVFISANLIPVTWLGFFVSLFQNFLSAEVQQSDQFEKRDIRSGWFSLLLPPIPLEIGVTSLLQQWPCGRSVAAFWEIMSQSRAAHVVC